MVTGNDIRDAAVAGGVAAGLEWGDLAWWPPCDCMDCDVILRLMKPHVLLHLTAVGHMEIGLLVECPSCGSVFASWDLEGSEADYDNAVALGVA